MSYAMGAAAIIIASVASYGILTGDTILPQFTGPVLAVGIISTIAYSFVTRVKIQ